VLTDDELRDLLALAQPGDMLTKACLLSLHGIREDGTESKRQRGRNRKLLERARAFCDEAAKLYGLRK
jgi:hypothetical protein